MEIYTLLIVFLIGLIIIRRFMRQRSAGPEATVQTLLRRYDSFRKSGLSERQAQLRLLSERRGWNTLPEPFLKEIIGRLGSKEDLMRFVTLAEGYEFIGSGLPTAAEKEDVEAGIFDIACVLARFGNQLQEEGQLKQAEFVQRLTLRLQPNQYFTNLALAVTYFKLERYDEALNELLEEGVANRIARYREAGLTLPIISPRGDGPDALRVASEAIRACAP